MGAPRGEGEDDHLVPLGETEWSLWRWVCVRAAGFSASLPGRLVATEAARAADDFLAAEARHRDIRDRVLAALEARAAVGRDDEALFTRLRRARKRILKDAALQAEDVVDLDPALVANLDKASLDVMATLARVNDALGKASVEVSSALREFASHPVFREAVTWQNRAAVVRVLDPLASKGERLSRNWKQRQREELVANYVHRYATKNDTIGFFGPVGWGVAGCGSERVKVTPGPRLVSSRETCLEQWGIDVIAKLFSADARLWPWLVPYRYGFVESDETTASSPITGSHTLSPAEHLVLAACQAGETTRTLAERLVREHPAILPATTHVDAALKALAAKGLVAVSLEFGTTWRPDAELRRRVQAIEDAALRKECLMPLDKLEEARANVGAAAGDAERLREALAALDRTFEDITGASSSRNAGAMYVSRGLIWEDCRRDLELHVGASLVDELAPALDLVLTSARHLTWLIGRAYESAFRDLYNDIAAGKPTIPFQAFWFRAQRLLHGKKRPLDKAAQDVREQWGRILTLDGSTRDAKYRSSDLDSAVRASFDAPRAGWAAARHHCPDIMIAAPSVAAINAGDYVAVLGEVHVAMNTLDRWWVKSLHPTPDALDAAEARDIPEPRVRPVPSKEGIMMGPVRMSRAFFTSQDYDLEADFFPSRLPRERALPIAEMAIEEDSGALMVVAHEGRFRLPLIELVGSVTLRETVPNALGLVPETRHSPRVTIDRLVVSRETWRVSPSELAFARLESETSRFVSARRWARELGLPRFVYMRSSLEVKPIYVDFDSPIAVNICLRLVRRALEDITGEATLTFSEMLPTLEDTWLTDASGERYTSELRFVAVDRRR